MNDQKPIRVKSLEIVNVGLIENETVVFDKPLILFYGAIQQGKTTFLNAVRWVMGGAFPDDIIRHGQKEALIKLTFDGGLLSREFYIGKNGTKAREITFVRNGKPVPSPVSEIKRLLNPFLLNQDHLRNMSETERRQYFTEMFAVDTTALDTENYNLDREATTLRAEIKGFGEIDLTEVKAPNLQALKGEREERAKAYSSECDALDRANADATDRNSKVARGREALAEHNKAITELEAKIEAAKAQRQKVIEWLDANPELVLRTKPPTPKEIETLDARISDAAAQQVRHEQYLANKARAEKKAEKEKDLKAKETRMKAIKAEKVAKLATVSESCGIKDLAFAEDGTFTYQGTQAGMLSTSQIMRLSSDLSALYPPGFSMDLVDRGESLGASIFDYVERAKANETTILATIVGEEPAVVPADIGVFVVEAGKLKKGRKAAPAAAPAKTEAPGPDDDVVP